MGSETESALEKGKELMEKDAHGDFSGQKKQIHIILPVEGLEKELSCKSEPWIHSRL